MSRLEKAIEILEAINAYYQDCEGQSFLCSDAQILDSDETIKDAIADCLGDEESDEIVKVVPRSQRRRYGTNVWGNTNGYIGRRKVKEFGLDKEAAIRWVNEQDN